MGSASRWTGLLGGEPDGTLASVTALVGAGVSVDAGLPVAYGLFDEVVRCLVRRRWAAEELMRLARSPRRHMRDEHDFIRFETLLLWVGRIFDPRLELFAFLDEFTLPAELHHRLAHASGRGLRLVTVNFDDLLERALAEQGFRALTVDVQQALPQDASGSPVYKLHGTRLRHTDGRTTVEGRPLLATTQVIAATNPGTFLNGGAAKMLSELVDGRTLLVAGYSASDDLDVVPTLAASRPARVVWVDHRDSTPRRSRLGAGRSSLPWKRLLAAMRDGGAEVTAITGRTAEVFEALGLTRPADAHQAAVPDPSVATSYAPLGAGGPGARPDRAGARVAAVRRSQPLQAGREGARREPRVAAARRPVDCGAAHV